MISARSAALDAELAERDERRDRTVSGLVAAATLIALPPTLLLASSARERHERRRPPLHPRPARLRHGPTRWPGSPSSSSS
ncbi:hypothetical protein [Streptomyces violaceus]|uniref:hypothetical protein n=1 Tax=Streptomyces violaceus TaxID=1936 RepID=UPI0031E61553